MWIFNEKTREYLPFSEKVCEKVYYDGNNGWAVKYKDGNVVHVSNEVFEKEIKPKLEKEDDDDDKRDGMRKFRRKRRLAELLSGKGDNKEAILAALLDDED